MLGELTVPTRVPTRLGRKHKTKKQTIQILLPYSYLLQEFAHYLTYWQNAFYMIAPILKHKVVWITKISTISILLKQCLV